MNNFDKNTLGNTPAAIYLIDILNNTEKNKAQNILRMYSSFTKSFGEMKDAYEKDILSEKTFRQFCVMFRKSLKETRIELANKNYDVKIINLYENLVIGKIKSEIRVLDIAAKVKISAISRAKDKIKNKGEKLNNNQIETFGQCEGKKFDINVNFNEYGLPELNFDKNRIEDRINAQSLMEKSQKRIERRNQKIN